MVDLTGASFTQPQERAMDIREIYRLHQQYSQSPVTIDMGAAEDHAAPPALTYAAGAKRRWDQHKPALKVAVICCAFIALAAAAGLGLGDLYAKKGRTGPTTSAEPEKVTHAAQTQAPSAPASASVTESATAVTQGTAAPVEGSTLAAPAAAPASAQAASPAPVAQPPQTAISAAQVAPREHVSAPEKAETAPPPPAARRPERPVPAQTPPARTAQPAQPAAAAPRAATPPARTTEANRPSGEVKMF
ncbi:hypothetical protein [Ralstonia pseudosolanacearum]|uniref:hypothetical protein n=1 Tax=Ralstonia pseudosolanacearum TaxID=1310165 RepID=UPI003CE7CBB5